MSAFSSWTDAEVRRWLHLRAIEWASWPAFVSQLVAPLLLIAWPWYAVVAGVWGVNALWSPIRYRFVSPSLANLACIAVAYLKWPLAIGCAIYLFIHHAYLPATLALVWPLIAGFIFFGGQVGRIELSFARKIGYVSGGSWAQAHTRNTTTTTSASLPIGSYKLDTLIEGLPGLTEFSETEYSAFVRRFEFEGERIFHAPPVSLINQQWKVDVGTVRGKIYKVALYFESECKETVTEVSKDLMKFCQQFLGPPSQQEEAFYTFYTWDAADGNVVMQIGKIQTTYMINLVETSRAVRTFAPKR